MERVLAIWGGKMRKGTLTQGDRDGGVWGEKKIHKNGWKGVWGWQRSGTGIAGFVRGGRIVKDGRGKKTQAHKKSREKGGKN